MTTHPLRTVAAALALAVAAGLPAAATPSLAAATTLKPVDEAAKDKSFLRFRATFLKIVERRDLKAFRRYLHPNIKISFGTANGINATLREMRKNPKRWVILARLLRQGGKFTGRGKNRMFFAPYTFFAELPGGVGGYDVVTITGTRVRVHSRPDLKSPTIARLSHKVVRVDLGKTDPHTGGWTRIKLGDGRVGYVLSKFAKSPIDYRVGFVRYKGGWKLRTFVAGD